MTEKKREWRIFAVPVGSFSGGSGFSEFLHGLAGGNPAYQARASRSFHCLKCMAPAPVSGLFLLEDGDYGRVVGGPLPAARHFVNAALLAMGGPGAVR